MTVSTIASIAAGLTRSQENGSARSSSVIANLIKTAAPAAQSSDTTNITSAIALQNQIAQFRVAAQNVAQADSVLSTAANGATEIARALNRLKALAEQAQDPALSADERSALSSEFQSIRGRISATAQNTRYNNESLLDGTSQQLKVPGEDQNLSVGSLTDEALFGSAKLDLSTQANAKATQEAVQKAIDYAAAQVKNISTLQNGLDIAASSLQTAIQNQEAANSNLGESDIASLLGQKNDAPTLQVPGDPRLLTAQANRVPNSLLALLGE